MARILVVDDEPDLRAIMRRLLQRVGHEVLEARNGEIAMELVGESPPDLVVTDLMMPVMDGHELIRRLRAEPSTADLPVLAMTGHSERKIEAEVTVITKPFPLGRFLEAVEGLLTPRGGRP